MRALALAVLLAAAPAALAEPVPLDLNVASLEQLEGLPGIGHKKAEAIVELRKHRPFTRLTQLLEVRGIGRKTLERLKPYVRFEEPKH